MTRKLLLVFAASVLSLAAVAQQSGPMLMPPYLQAVTAHSVYVLVESSSTDTVFVEYGPTPAFGMKSQTESIEPTTNSTFVHNIKLIELSPNKEYYYRALQSQTASPSASFRSAVLAGTPFRFAWMADCRSGIAVHDSIAKRIGEARPVMSLYGGDLCARSSYASFKEEFFRPLELALIGRVPFSNAPGNHEGWSVNTKAFTQAPSSASGTQDYFSFDYGDMHVLVLNTEIDYSEGSPQYVFAEKDLVSSTATWKIVIAHKHAYSAGGHGEDSDLKAMATKIFEPNRVDMVISGHSHFYQKNFVNGIYHLIIGSAGAPLYSPSQEWYTLKSVKDYNYAIVDVAPESFKMIVFNDRGAVLDSLNLSKSPEVKKSKPGAPEGFRLDQRYPRPFNTPSSIVRSGTPKSVLVQQ